MATKQVGSKSSSPKAQLEAYLSRVRHTLPFPCTAEECYLGLMPELISKWNKEDGFRRLTGRQSNLALTMARTYEGQILHVCIEPKDKYIAARAGLCGYEEVFWFKAPGGFPAPSVRLPFFLPNDHAYDTPLRDWAATATAIEAQVNKAMTIVDRYFGIVKTPTQIKNTWPELMHVLKFRGGTVAALSNQLSNRLRKKIDAVVSTADREFVSTELARSLMLPEKNEPLKAWVNFHTQEGMT